MIFVKTRRENIHIPKNSPEDNWRELDRSRKLEEELTARFPPLVDA